MSDMQIFESDRFGQVRIVERNGEPWFVARDVAACIDYDPSSVNKMCNLCRERDRYVASASDFDSDNLSESGNARITLISESGLYRILAKCNLPKCEPFESWVFDEVLPSIRKTGAYSIAPKTYVEALRALANEIEQKELAEAQRDEAIRTKAWIGNRREATAMNTASQKSKECERLREQLGDAQNWKAVTAIPWLREYFALSKGLYGAVANKLKAICIERGLERRDIPDVKYGTVKAYPIEAINILFTRVIGDPNMLGKYRIA